EPQDGKPIRPAAQAHAPALEQGRDDTSLTAWLGPLIFIGATLLVIGGLAGHWWGSGEVNQVKIEAQLEIAKAKTEGAQVTIASLQSDLLGVLRDTLGDDAVSRPLGQAITELERALVVLPVDSAGPSPGGATVGSEAAPAAPPPGSAASPGAGSAAVAAGGAKTEPGSTAAGADSEARLRRVAGQLRATRDNLLRISQA